MKHNGANNVKIILRNFACDICSITFTTQSHLSYHKNRAHKAKEIGKNIGGITSKEYKCPVCQKDFQTKDLITDHIKTAHKTLDDQSKKIALDMIDKLEIEVEERKKNELETFPCRVCNKRFITKHFLNKHVESLHNTSNSEASTRDTLVLILKNDILLFIRCKSSLFSECNNLRTLLLYDKIFSFT